MTKKPQALKSILAYQNRIIDRLSQQINQQLTCVSQIKSALPNELASHVLHCVQKDKKLFVYTDAANWASQLRFHGETMLDALNRPPKSPVSAIQIKIIGSLFNETAYLKRKPKIPSAAVRNEVNQQALITEDPELKQALEKLSSTLDRLHVRK